MKISLIEPGRDCEGGIFGPDKFFCLESLFCWDIHAFKRFFLEKLRTLNFHQS